VSVNDVTAERLVRTGGAVVGALRTRVATNGPAKGPVHVLLKEGVLLLDTVPVFGFRDKPTVCASAIIKQIRQESGYKGAKCSVITFLVAFLSQELNF
jgi:hypothetical protein